MTQNDLSVTLPEAFQTIASTWRRPGGHKTVFSLLGEPGIGKSAMRQPLATDLAPDLGIPPERDFFQNVSHWDVTDYDGIPDLSGDVCRGRTRPRQ